MRYQPSGVYFARVRIGDKLIRQRFFYCQWVEDLFVETADTVGGTATHRQTDKPSALPEDPKELELPEGVRLRSLQLESETLGLVGMNLKTADES